VNVVKPSTAKEWIRTLAICGAILAFIFGYAVLNIIYHIGVPDDAVAVIPGFNFIFGFAIAGVIMLVVAFFLDKWLSRIMITIRRRNRAKSEIILNEKYVKEQAFKAKWAPYFLGRF
jgi:sterol desaturase/sphingolipid hydroxylase (fatty acid hydroxylase superfamily)